MTFFGLLTTLVIITIWSSFPIAMAQNLTGPFTNNTTNSNTDTFAQHRHEAIVEQLKHGPCNNPDFLGNCEPSCPAGEHSQMGVDTWMDCSPDESVYIPNQGSNTVTAIDGFTNKVIATIPVGVRPITAISSLYSYILNSGSNTVSVIYATTNKVIATIPVGQNPSGILDSDLPHIYVANSGSNTVSAINSTTNKVVATIPVGVSPHS